MYCTLQLDFENKTASEKCASYKTVEYFKTLVLFLTQALDTDPQRFDNIIILLIID